jgi:hypothetical protein
MTTLIATVAAPLLTYHAEMSFACTYAMRRPKLARACARTALMAEHAAKRPDLACRANALLGAL